jgi:hypothetical protein
VVGGMQWFGGGVRSCGFVPILQRKIGQALDFDFCARNGHREDIYEPTKSNLINILVTLG